MRNILTQDLCNEFQQQLVRYHYSADSLRRYIDILNDFSHFGFDQYYSQKLGVDYLVHQLKIRGGLAVTDRESRKQEYIARCMRKLEEYYYFGIVMKREEINGEIIWPDGFRECTEQYYEELNKNGLSRGYIVNSRKTIKDLILFLSRNGIHTPEEITQEHNDHFIESYYWMSPKGIETKLCLLRKYYRFLYLNRFINTPLAERLPKASIQGRMQFPTVWTPEQITKITEAAERVSPSGKRSYAMIMLASRLGLRIGDIRNLKLSDIDWESKIITIVQKKTGNVLTLPLPDDVGWAIIDYLKNGRPVTDSPNVIVRHVPPYDSFPINSSLNYILTTVMNRADIPPEKKENCGWHSFRRSLATALLQNNVEMNVISEILGHNDPDIAGKYYIQITTEKLTCCALSVEVKSYVS